MTGSAKTIFSQCLHRFVEAKTAEMAREYGAGEHDTPAERQRILSQFARGASPFDVLRRLATDPRAESLWSWLGTDETLIVAFLKGTAEALIGFWTMDLAEEIQDTWEEQSHRAYHAAMVLLRFCEVARAAPPSPHDLPSGFEDQLRVVANCIAEKNSLVQQMFEPMRPNSRKMRSDFLPRVHFPQLMVREMLRRFKRPRYQEVADTTTVLFDLPNGLSADNVCKAWKRHQSSGKKDYSGGQIAAK